MARKLTENQQKALDFVNQKRDVTIQEVAEATGMAYPTASQALHRLYILNAVTKERLGDGTNKVIYRRIVLENPESDDPLEQAFAAPAAEKPIDVLSLKRPKPGPRPRKKK